MCTRGKRKKSRKEPLKVQRDHGLTLVRNAASVDRPAEQAGMLEFSIQQHQYETLHSSMLCSLLQYQFERALL